jgi:hypothetical protein
MILESERILVELSEATGAVVRIHDKSAGIELIRDARLARAFQLVLPTEQSQANEISSDEQSRPTITRTTAGATLRWPGPLVAPHGTYDIDVELSVEVNGARLAFRYTLANASDRTVAEVHGPVFGGVVRLGERAATRLMVPLSGSSAGEDLFQSFRGFGGGMEELGSPVPEYLFKYPGELPMPWIDIYDEALGRGMSLAALDEGARQYCLRIAVHPGIGHGRDHPWPSPDEVDADLPTGLTATWVSFPYVASGSTFTGPEIVVTAHDGDWHEAAREYRRWFDERVEVPKADKAGWLRSAPAFLDTMFLLPEGNVNLRFADMGAWAEGARRCGVDAVLVSGWDVGGHDAMYPAYEPDPRLGTWDELAAGIAACHEIGVRVFFFVNLQPVDCTTDWYERELHSYRSMDPWGVSTPMGWGMGTVAARLGATRKPLVFASPAFPQLRDIVVRQMRTLAEIGADGIHVDKLAWSTVPLEFNPASPLPPDRATWEGILAFLDEVEAACRAVSPEFAISHEGTWDRVLEWSSVAWAWHSTWERDHTAAFKYAFPEWFPALAVSQPYDFNVVNAAVRFGYQLLIGPGNYTKGMDYPPMRGLGRYIEPVNALRRELADLLILGTFEDGHGATVEHGPDVRYATHRAASGRRACVIVNYGGDPQMGVVRELAGAAAVRVHEPSAPARNAELPVELEIPGERLCVVEGLE